MNPIYSHIFVLPWVGRADCGPTGQVFQLHLCILVASMRFLPFVFQRLVSSEPLESCPVGIK